MIEIPPSRLDEELLTAIIEAFVLREGTDYGAMEVSMERKIAEVREQIHSGKVVIVYDEESETCNLLSREKYGKHIVKRD